MEFGLSKAPSEYKNIIFDLGGVILNLSYAKTLEEFRKRLPHLPEEGFVGKVKQVQLFDDFETGKITSAEFRAGFCKHYEIELSDEDFDICWNGMILDIPIERIELLKRLRAQGKKLFLLSNINEIHEIAVENAYAALKLQDQFHSLFDKVYYSHLVGMRKPDKEIFERVVRENGLVKGETLFIDDSVQHVEGARECGVDGLHLIADLKIEGLGLL